MHHKHPRHKKYLKKEGHLKWASWKGSTLKAKFKMDKILLPQSSRCRLNLNGLRLSLVKVIALVALAYFRLLYLVGSYKFLDLSLKV
jgi:hypothetical protein